MVFQQSPLLLLLSLHDCAGGQSQRLMVFVDDKVFLGVLRRDNNYSNTFLSFVRIADWLFLLIRVSVLSSAC